MCSTSASSVRSSAIECAPSSRRRGSQTAVHYPLAITQQPAYRSLATRPCPVAEAWAAETLTVPCAPELTDDEVETVASALANVADR